jgi:Spy/CpxP family protein refolding chaperone
MKNIINLKAAALFVFLLIFSIPTFAQPGGGQGGRRQMTEEDVKERVKRTADSLDLTSEQEKKILAIELEYFEKNREMRENFDPETGDREAMREFMMKQREEREEKYAKILTDKQWEKYQIMMDRRRQQMRQRQEENSDGQRGRGRG